MVTVTVSVDNETANIYEQASAADKKKMQLLLSLWLREFEKPSVSLEKLMDNVSRKARERGLTSEILESTLHG
ncbi:MAG TPA: hypothetical protein VI753_05675 [Anaerolineales bacterium]|nr:hypothetical protein [Anaerolineales bacterium]